jgi:hypothetical protein
MDCLPDAHAATDQYRDTHLYGDLHTYCYIYRNFNTDTNSDEYYDTLCHAASHQYCDGNSNAFLDTYCDFNGVRYANRIIDAILHYNCVAHAVPNIYANAYLYTGPLANSIADTNQHSITNPDRYVYVFADRYGHVHAFGHAYSYIHSYPYTH